MISITQLVFLFCLIFFLFSDLSKIRKNVTKNIANIKAAINKEQQQKKLK